MLDAEQKEAIEREVRLEAKRQAYVREMKPKTLEELRKVNPKINEEGYRLYLEVKKLQHVFHDPELNDSVERAQRIFKDTTDVTISRLYAPILKETRYNENFIVSEQSNCGLSLLKPAIILRATISKTNLFNSFWICWLMNRRRRIMNGI